jgi:autotransporter-associated beta strand protein
VGGTATGGTWSGGTGTFSPDATTLNATYTPSTKEQAAGSWALTLTPNSPLCTGTPSTMIITFIPQVTLALVTNTSSLAISICLDPSTDTGGGNIIDLGLECTNAANNLFGDMTVQLDSLSQPTQITLQDFHFKAMSPYVLGMNWLAFGVIPLGVTATVGTLDQPATLYDAHLGTAAPTPVNPDGSFTLSNVVFAVSALAYYGGTASGSIDLSGVGAVITNDVAGTIHVTNEVASVHMDFTIVENFLETGSVTVTGYAQFNGVIDAVGATTVPRYMVWNGGAGNWNTTSANWNHGSAIWDNQRPDNAIFNATGDPMVTVTEPITAKSLWFESGSAWNITADGNGGLALVSPYAITNDVDATISAPITSGSLNKWGGSKLTLSGVNTYAGATTIGAGNLEFASPAAMGSTSGITVQNGAEVSFGSASFASAFNGQTVSQPIGLNGILHTYVPGGQIGFAGPITLQGSSQIYGEAAQSSTVNLNSVISGNGNLTFFGAGGAQATFVLAAANSYTSVALTNYSGGLSVRAWNNTNDPGCIGGGTIDGPQFDLANPNPAPNASTAGGTIGYATQSIYMNNSETEHFTATDGCGVAAPGPFPTGYVDNYCVEYRGKLYIATAGNYNFATTSDDGSALWLDAGANPTYAQAIVKNNAPQGMIQVASGAQALTAGYHDIIIRYNQGTGGNGLYVQWDPTGGSSFVPIPGANFASIPNVYALGGDTYITNSGATATVQLSGGNDRLPTSSVVYMSAPGNSSVLDLNGNSQTLAGVADFGATAGIRSVRNLSGTASALRLNGAGSYAYSGTVDGNLSVTKSGNGTQALSGANTYTGNTIINAGTLALGSSLSSSSSITLAAGATLDVSAATGGFTLGSAATLTANGNASAATIVGPLSGTVNLGSQPIVLNYDSSHPALRVSQGTLSLGGNHFTIDTAQALDVGDYPVIQASSDITSTGPCTISGTAIGQGFAGSIVVSGSQVTLHIISIAIPTTTTLGAITTPQVYGSVVLSASVTANDLSAVSGNITFKDGATVLGTVPLVSGAATLSTILAVNGGASHAIQAKFSDPAVIYASSLSGISNVVITARTITVTGTKNYDGLPVVGANNLVVDRHRCDSRQECRARSNRRLHLYHADAGADHRRQQWQPTPDQFLGDPGERSYEREHPGRSGRDTRRFYQQRYQRHPKQRHLVAGEPSGQRRRRDHRSLVCARGRQRGHGGDHQSGQRSLGCGRNGV